jgi:hypothetical protein
MKCETCEKCGFKKFVNRQKTTLGEDETHDCIKEVRKQIEALLNEKRKLEYENGLDINVLCNKDSEKMEYLMGYDNSNFHKEGWQQKCQECGQENLNQQWFHYKCLKCQGYKCRACAQYH